MGKLCGWRWEMIRVGTKRARGIHTTTANEGRCMCVSAKQRSILPVALALHSLISSPSSLHSLLWFLLLAPSLFFLMHGAYICTACTHAGDSYSRDPCAVGHPSFGNPRTSSYSYPVDSKTLPPPSTKLYVYIHCTQTLYNSNNNVDGTAKKK